MWALCKKELSQFFSSLSGYIAIAVFLLVNGLVLFVFEDNVLDYGYATLDRFFELAPWILLLLIPAITMRSFAEEFRTGTWEVLRTQPLTDWQIIGGKFAGAFFSSSHCTLSNFFIFMYCSCTRSRSRIGLGSYHWVLFRVVFASCCFYCDWYLV